MRLKQQVSTRLGLVGTSTKQTEIGTLFPRCRNDVSEGISAKTIRCTLCSEIETC